MESVKESYDPNCWICIGPQLLTDTARTLANTKAPHTLVNARGL